MPSAKDRGRHLSSGRCRLVARVAIGLPWVGGPSFPDYRGPPTDGGRAEDPFVDHLYYIRHECHPADGRGAKCAGQAQGQSRAATKDLWPVGVDDTAKGTRHWF